MPDGFDPHRELERIETMREMMRACRGLTSLHMANLQNCMSDPEAHWETRIKAGEMAMNRGWGKPIQQVRIIDQSKSESPVKVVLPDNGRPNLKMNGPIIDAT